MRLALKNIQKPNEPVSRKVQIVKRLSANKYQATDVYGRTYNVYSGSEWKPRTYVMIQNGEILREIGKVQTPTSYKG